MYADVSFSPGFGFGGQSYSNFLASSAKEETRNAEIRISGFEESASGSDSMFVPAWCHSMWHTCVINSIAKKPSLQEAVRSRAVAPALRDVPC